MQQKTSNPTNKSSRQAGVKRSSVEAKAVTRKEGPLKSAPVFPRLASLASWLLILVLILSPFHALFTVWGASLGLDYTALRLWSVVAIGALVVLSAYFWWRDVELRNRLTSVFLFMACLIYGIFVILMLARGLAFNQVSPPAGVYGAWLDLRYLILFFTAVVVMKYSPWRLGVWLRAVLAAGAVVALFAVLQYLVLPPEVLQHAGYGPDTIAPYSTINSNDDYIRVISTTRGPNSLGAYMLVISVLTAVLWSKVSKQRRSFMVLLLGLSLAAMAFSFSRSAWVGLLLAGLMLIALQLRSRRHFKVASLVLVGVAFIAGITLSFIDTNRSVQNVIFHTDDKSEIAVSSNDAREAAMTSSLATVLKEPLGRGPGTAGPASVHNSESSARIAENYYLQIAQELGWAGFILFITILLMVGFELWVRRSRLLVMGLLASAVGLAVVNLLSHAWTDDTLAFTWWGLAGIVLGSVYFERPNLARKEETDS